jgi:hypothetical protein
MKPDKNLLIADIVYFDLINPSEKKWENSNRGQKMSAKICQKFLYCELTLAASHNVRVIGLCGLCGCQSTLSVFMNFYKQNPLFNQFVFERGLLSRINGPYFLH